MEWLRRSALSLCVLLLAGCGGGSPSPGTSGSSATTGGEAPSWTLPPDPMALARQAGLTPDVKEYVDFHEHAHLDVFVNGRPVVIPGGIGIETTDPAVIKFGESHYGGIPEEGCEQVCISPLHTHEADGVIHLEAQAAGQFTLGQLFEELAIRLDASCVGEYCAPGTPVAVYVDGQPQSGNPADIVLGDLQEIAIVIGTPPAVIPDSFSGAQ
jgi:hypothetical protein